jgi:hypothetical protein
MGAALEARDLGLQPLKLLPAHIAARAKHTEGGSLDIGGHPGMPRRNVHQADHGSFT